MHDAHFCTCQASIEPEVLDGRLAAGITEEDEHPWSKELQLAHEPRGTLALYGGPIRERAKGRFVCRRVLEHFHEKKMIRKFLRR
jgi:hypothetical protein